MIPDVLEPALFGWDEASLSRMNAGEYGGRVLARMAEAALEQASSGGGRLVNYQQLPGVVWPSLMRYWGVDAPEQAPEMVARVCRFQAKNPALPFSDDTESKNRAASEEMRNAARQWLDGIYQRLEDRRLAQAG